MVDKILICGFDGSTNSAKLLLDNLSITNKLYLKNDFEISVNQLINTISNDVFARIIILGQKPVIKSLYIEAVGMNLKDILVTNYDILKMKDYFADLGYKIKISNNAE